MSRSPSIVPREADQDIYLVLDDFGAWLGRVWSETDEEDTDRETLIRDLMDGQYSHPVRIVAFNTAQGWSRDVTVDIADELRRRFAEYDEVPDSMQEFLEGGCPALKAGRRAGASVFLAASSRLLGLLFGGLFLDTDALSTFSRPFSFWVSKETKGRPRRSFRRRRHLDAAIFALAVAIAILGVSPRRLRLLISPNEQ
jgi:hypothetical protein